MVDDHTHGDDGHVVIVEAEPPEVVEAEAAADAAVKVAEIEADTAVKLARLDLKRSEVYADEDMAALRAENEVLRTELAALQAPPEPVIVQAPDPEPEPVAVPAPDEPVEAPPPADGADSGEKPKKTVGLGMW